VINLQVQTFDNSEEFINVTYSWIDDEGDEYTINDIVPTYKLQPYLLKLLGIPVLKCASTLTELKN
jgi:hypothetical protein